MTAGQIVATGEWSEWVQALPDVLTIEEVAEVLRLKPDTVRKLCRENKLPGAFKVGDKEWRVGKATLLDYVASEIRRSAAAADAPVAPENTDR